ncbi:TcmI family type II polyketide cyclase [Saccharomonospora xinjiangensis]|uniref:Polyketide synthesis cyclase n=1 Tax=Saccharomonospora xinjiangensis XJ-54 TaxID=882086 RepID=I0V8U8_9PSEU|nr:TcmI family type II polyketide cyclase [Saccharomonospora xinjiangensis]EID56551.1 Polyketide synthesis cyclase [Saccharomonospora xinjiangensis XJ-54]
MNRTLIVARMDEADSEAVAALFAESDAGPLPARVGVRARTLFRFHGLYFHLIEADGDVGTRVERVRSDPDVSEFRDLSAALDAYIRPFDPETWRSPSDAMATPFYHWRATP